MLQRRSFTALCLWWTVLLGFPGISQTVELRTFFDLDNNGGTGCTLTTVDGTFAGVDAVLITTVDVVTSQVVLLEHQFCSGGILGPRIPFDSTTWPVGLGFGYDGTDVVEAYLPIDTFEVAPNVRVGFDANNLNGGEDAALLDQGGGPLEIFIYTPVPTLGSWIFILFCFIILVTCLWFMRKSSGPRRHLSVLLALLSMGLGAYRMSGIFLDGDPSDWPPHAFLTFDPAGETPDIAALYGVHVSGRIYVRVDVSLNTPPVANQTSATLLEDDSTLIGLTGSDADGDALVFSISSAPSNGLLSGLASTGSTSAEVTYTPDADFFGADSFIFQVDDGNGGFATALVNITIDPVNDAPSFTPGPDQVINEDAGPQRSVVRRVPAWATNILAGPGNESTQVLTFTITGNTNPGLLSAGPSVDPITGDLSFTPSADQNGMTTISVQLMDDGGTSNGGVDVSAIETFTITISDVNDAPSFTAGPNQTVLEDAGSQTVSAWATSISPGPPDEAGQILTFNVTGNTNPSLFSAGPSVDPISGDLTYTPAADANGSATITLELMDDGGTANGGEDTSAPQSFTIDVTPVNDQPSFTAGTDQTVLEDAGTQTVVGWATAISAGPTNEASQVLSFNITNNSNPGLFSSAPSINPSTGDLTYTPAANAHGSATLNLELMDDGGTANGGIDVSTPETLTITVTSVNDVPSFASGPDQSVLEDAGAQTIAGWATAISAGPTNESAQVLTFNISGNTNPSLFSAGPAIDSATGTLTYTPTNDANGSATITLELMDDGGTANGGLDTSPTQSFVVTVTAVNDAPSFTISIDPVTFTGVSSPQTVPGVATAISPGPSDETGQTLNFNITGNTNPSIFAVAPSLDSTGTLTYTPEPLVSGTATITVELMDSGGTANGGIDTSASQSFVIDISSLNQQPSFTDGGNVTVNEDSGANTVAAWATAMDDGDGGTQTLTFMVTGNTNTALFSVQPAVNSLTGELSFTTAADAFGNATIDIVLMDDGGTAGGGIDTSSIHTFDITLNPINDAPTFTTGGNVTVAEDSGAYSNGWAGSPSAGPTNESGQTLTFLVSQTSTNNVSLFDVAPQIDAAGNLSFTPAADEFGTAVFDVTLSDDGGTTNGGVDTSSTVSFQVEVTSVNDPPSVADETFATAGIRPVGNTVFEFANSSSVSPAVYVTGTVLDNDSDIDGPMALSITTFDAASVAGGSVTMNLTTGEFTYTPPVGFTGADSFTYEVTDSITPATGTVNLTVTDMVWYINNQSAAGDGRSNSPFNTITDFTSVQGAGVGAPAPGQTIFIHNSPGVYSGLIGLLDGQSLLGQGVDLIVDGNNLVITPGNPTYANGPSITNPSGDVVVLADNNRVAGMILLPVASAGISSGSIAAPPAKNKVGTAIIEHVSFEPNNISEGLNLDNRTGTLTLRELRFLGSVVGSNRGIVILNSPGSLVLNVENVTIDSLGTGIELLSNLGTTLNLNGVALGLSTPNRSGIDSNDGGILNSVGLGVNSIASSGGPALQIANTSPTAINLTFDHISSLNSTGVGIGIDSVNGSFTVTGTTTITDHDMNGIQIQNSPSSNFDFSSTTITDTAIGAGAAGDGIDLSLGNTGATFTFDNLNVVTDTGTGILANDSGTINIQSSVSGATITADQRPALNIISTLGQTNGTPGWTFSNLVSNNSNSDGLNLTSLSDPFSSANTTINTPVSHGISLSTCSGSFTFSTIDIDNTGIAGVRALNITGPLNVLAGSIVNSIGSAIEINGGSSNINIAASVTNTTGRSVDITGRTGGAIDLSGSLNDTGMGLLVNGNTSGTTTFSNASKVLNTGSNQAVTLTSNMGHTINFTNGGLDVDTSGTANAFVATGGGTVTVGGTGNSLDSSNADGSGMALNVNATTIGASGLTFESINAGSGVPSAGVGISLVNTGTVGGLTVTGVGSTAGSGGTIQNKTGANGSTTAGVGIMLDNTVDTSLSFMQLNDFDNFAIRGNSVTRLTLSNTVINGTNGNSAAFDEGSVSFMNLLDSASFTNNTISGGHEDNLLVINDTGSLNRMTVENGTIGLNATATGNDGISVEARNSATLNITVRSVTFSGARGDMFQANTIDNSTMDVIVEDNSFQNSHSNIVSAGGGITLSGGGMGSNFNMTYLIRGTTPGSQAFTGADGNAITVNFVSGAGTAIGTIQNNSIGLSGASGSGSLAASGIMVGASQNVAHTSTIDSNTIREVDGFGGIDLIANVDGTMNVTVTNNHVADMGGFSIAALTALFGGNNTETGTLCLDVRNNTFDASGGPSTANAVYLDQISTLGQYNLPGYVGSGNGEFATCGAGTASVDIDVLLNSNGNTMTNGAFPLFPAIGTDASIVCGVTGSGTTCP